MKIVIAGIIIGWALAWVLAPVFISIMFFR